MILTVVDLIIGFAAFCAVAMAAAGWLGRVRNKRSRPISARYGAPR